MLHYFAGARITNLVDWCICRPIATLLSLVFPTWAIVATDRNTMFPELQKEWDMGMLRL